ncbi:MAG: murein hydrolase activator EnvC family protein [Solirubrobacteraceae bacterium]
MSRLLCVTLLAFLLVADPAMAASWRRPVDGEPTRRFAVGPDRFAAGQHRGVDLAAPVGTPVRAACGGRVRFAGTVGDAGRTVSVTCGGLVASYLHLATIDVHRGGWVPPGARIGSVGRSGRPRGAPHLHLGARRVTDGRYVDPLTLLGSGPGPAPPVAPPAGRAPRPGLEPRVVPVPPRPVVAPAGDRAAVPWAAAAGLVVLVLGAVPAAAAGRRRRGREAADRAVHGVADARR